jgi:hypothetical protein
MARLDMGWHANPKVLKLGWAAMGLHAWSISYCDATRSDGFIPNGAWPSLTGGKAAVSTLVAAGIWESVDGGYALHDYLQYNRSRARIAEIGAVRAAAARAKSEQFAQQNGSNLLSKPPANGEQFATPGPGPGPGLTPGSLVRQLVPERYGPGGLPEARAGDAEPPPLLPEIRPREELPREVADRLSRPPIPEHGRANERTDKNSSKSTRDVAS